MIEISLARESNPSGAEQTPDQWCLFGWLIHSRIAGSLKDSLNSNAGSSAILVHTCRSSICWLWISAGSGCRPVLALDASRRQYSLSNPSSSSSIVFLVLESVDRIRSVAAHALPCRQLVHRHGLVVVPLAVVLMHGQASLAVVLMHGQG